MSSKYTIEQRSHATQESTWLRGLEHRWIVCRSTLGDQYVVSGNEAIDLQGNRARNLLATDFLRTYGRRPSKQLVDAAMGLLVAQAVETPPQEVPLRVGVVRSGPSLELIHGDMIVVDLLRPEGVAVIDASGVRVTPQSPVPFRRTEGMLALPVPELDVDVSLRELLEPIWPSGMSEQHKALAAGFLVTFFLPGIPKPHLLVVGPQGSGKSSLARFLRWFIDPHANPLLRPPRDTRELFVSVYNHALPCLDNLSGLKGDLADDLCGLASGTGFSTRQLYTDREVVQFSGTCGIIMTALYAPSLRSDLLDRLFVIELSPLQGRESDVELRLLFEHISPLVLGALLQTTYTAVRLWMTDRCTPANPIRMIDAHRLLLAATWSPHFGWSFAEVEAALRSSGNQLVELQQEASPVLSLLLQIAAQGFEGTAGELLHRLGALAPKLQARRGEIPRSPEEMGRALKEHEAALLEAGVVLERTRGGGKSNPRIIRLRLADAAWGAGRRKGMSLNPATFEKDT